MTRVWSRPCGGKSVELFTINSATRCLYYISHTLRDLRYIPSYVNLEARDVRANVEEKKFFSDRYRRSIDFAVVVVVVSDYLHPVHANEGTCVHAKEFRLIDIRNEHFSTASLTNLVDWKFNLCLKENSFPSQDNYMMNQTPICH